MIVDKSGSMQNQPVDKVFDIQLERLKQRSIDLNQETRISIYLFDTSIECLAFDMDVMRFKSLRGFWHPSGSTAMLDAIGQSVRDHKMLPQQYGNHAFLQIVITDGEENASRIEKPGTISTLLRGLPDNWTTGVFVPDANGVAEAKRFGIDKDSIAVWNTTAHNAMETVGKQFSDVVDNYMTMRSTGTRGTKSLFTLDTSALNKKTAKAILDELPVAEYDILPVRTREVKGVPIKEFVEQWQKSYRLGSAYYQPTKKVKIQDHKQVLIQNIKDGRVYEGSNLRQLLGLPNQTVEVDPGQHKDWRIFVQSTSTNRKLFNDTFLLVRK
jgi:hypothetical protein